MTGTMNRTVSMEMEHMLPSVLIDYLWRLADVERTDLDQGFVLKTRTMAGRQIQEIWHVADGKCISSHKVFGFQPVNATVLIHSENGEMQMVPGGLLEALGFASIDVESDASILG